MYSETRCGTGTLTYLTYSSGGRSKQASGCERNEIVGITKIQVSNCVWVDLGPNLANIMPWNAGNHTDRSVFGDGDGIVSIGIDNIFCSCYTARIRSWLCVLRTG